MIGVSKFTPIISNACPLIFVLDIIGLSFLSFMLFFAMIKDPYKLPAFAAVTIKFISCVKRFCHFLTSFKQKISMVFRQKQKPFMNFVFYATTDPL